MIAMNRGERQGREGRLDSDKIHRTVCAIRNRLSTKSAGSKSLVSIKSLQQHARWQQEISCRHFFRLLADGRFSFQPIQTAATLHVDIARLGCHATAGPDITRDCAVSLLLIGPLLISTMDSE